MCPSDACQGGDSHLHSIHRRRSGADHWTCTHPPAHRLPTCVPVYACQPSLSCPVCCLLPAHTTPSARLLHCLRLQPCRPATGTSRPRPAIQHRRLAPPFSLQHGPTRGMLLDHQPIRRRQFNHCANALRASCLTSHGRIDCLSGTSTPRTFSNRQKTTSFNRQSHEIC